MLELIGITKRFGDRTVLDGLGMGIQDGRLHGFVGRNGAGKTTAMRIVLGLLDADEGQVLLDGSAVTAEDRRRVGYMPEERGLYSQMTVVEQIGYFGMLSGMTAADARASATSLLERLGLTDRAADRAEALSLGNQQRVQLAVALVNRPRLLILDEPFSGLDPMGVDLLAGVLQDEAERGSAIVFSSHQLELVERLCDAVTIVEDGHVVATGAVEEVRRRHGRRRLRVALEGGWATWADALPVATVVDTIDGEIVMELEDEADDQQVLDAARAAGRVTSFRWTMPTLAELFREVVARTAAGDGDAAAEEVAA